jgi:hypothetical protein
MAEHQRLGPKERSGMGLVDIVGDLIEDHEA